jgi:pilus assembly protein CpaB
MARSVELIVNGDTVRSGTVEAGSWVAIFVSEDPEPHLADASAGKLPPLTRILLPRVRVLGVGAAGSGIGSPAHAARTTLTIAVTQSEAEKVIRGSRDGHLTFTPRSDQTQAGGTGSGITPRLYGSAS